MTYVSNEVLASIAVALDEQEACLTSFLWRKNLALAAIKADSRFKEAKPHFKRDRKRLTDLQADICLLIRLTRETTLLKTAVEELATQPPSNDGQAASARPDARNGAAVQTQLAL